MTRSSFYALVGLPSSGKSLFCQIASKFGFTIVIMGDLIRAETKKRGLKVTRKNTNEVMIDLRKKNGDDIIAMKTAEEVKVNLKNGKSKFIIEGIRSYKEIYYLRSIFPTLITIGLHSSVESRFLRTLRRRRDDDADNLSAFAIRDNLELSVGIGKAFSLVDFMINSEGNKEESRKLYDLFFTSILNPAQSVKLEVICEIKVNPTEDENIIKSIFLYFFPDCSILEDKRFDGKYFYIRGSNISHLTTFRQIIQDNFLSDVVRSRLIRNIEHKTLTSLYLNKQVAAINKISLLDYEDDPPLGPILIQFVTESEEDLFSLIDYIAPKSLDNISKADQIRNSRKEKRRESKRKSKNKKQRKRK